MAIILDKTNVMTTGGAKQLQIELNGQGLEQVKEFMYLGSTLTDTVKQEREVKGQNEKRQQHCRD